MKDNHTPLTPPGSSRYHKPGDAATVMMVSLSLILLAFFILLYTISSPNKDKESSAAIQIKKAFESLGGQFTSSDTVNKPAIGLREEVMEVNSKVEQFLSELQGYSEENLELKEFSYQITKEFFLLNIPSDFVFKRGATEINEHAYPFLEKIYDMIVRTTNPVRIEGHSDNLPLEKQGMDENWRLSAERAMSVLKYFLAQDIVSQSRYITAGYGSYRPIANNRFSQGRERNRRVSIIFVGKLNMLGGPYGG